MRVPNLIRMSLHWGARPFTRLGRLTGLAGIVLALAVSGCGNTGGPACHECTIVIQAADVAWAFESDASVATPDTALAPSAPILFVVYGPDGITPVPGVEITFFTSGSTLALVEPADRYTVQAIDDLTLIPYLNSLGYSFDYSIVQDMTQPDVIRRGIYPAVTDDHGAVAVWPPGYLPGCPAIPVGGTDITFNGELGVSAVIADDFNIWTATWSHTCKAPS